MKHILLSIYKVYTAWFISIFNSTFNFWQKTTIQPIRVWWKETEQSHSPPLTAQTGPWLGLCALQKFMTHLKEPATVPLHSSRQWARAKDQMIVRSTKIFSGIIVPMLEYHKALLYISVKSSGKTIKWNNSKVAF